MRAFLLPLALVHACTSTPAPPHTRPPLPLPPAVASYYALSGEVVEEQLVPIGGDGDHHYWRGRLRSGDERAGFFLIEPELADGAKPPILLLLPILAGGEDLMWLVADLFAERGWAVAWPERVASALREGQRGPALEDLLRRTVVHNRMLLAWLRDRSSLAGDATALVGISMGGMIGCAMLALEPELSGGALIISGADLAGLIGVTSEARAQSWRRWRRASDGIDGGSELEREFERNLLSDPIRLGAHVPTDEVLLVAARYDTVIPRRQQDLLWEALGRPRRRTIPLGHYTAALALWAIVDEADSFLRARIRD